MIDPEVRVQIRRYCYAEHWKVGTIAEALGVHPDTVKRAIEVDRFHRAEQLRSSMLDPYLASWRLPHPGQRFASSMARGRSPVIAAAATGSSWFSIRHISRLCCAPSARHVNLRATAVLELIVPESAVLLERAFAEGESAAQQSAQMLDLLDRCGARAMRRAVREALQRNTPRASSVAFLLRQSNSVTPLPLDLSRHPEAQNLEVRPHDLETYDELAHRRDDEPER